jgi:EamA domain-containing membrane protein RarD
MASNVEKSKSDTVWGVVYATSAFLIWGISPIYWKALLAIPALEIILHRIVWSFFFLALARIQGCFKKLPYRARSLVYSPHCGRKLAVVHLGGQHGSPHTSQLGLLYQSTG